MSDTSKINILVAIRMQDGPRFREGLKKEPQFNVTMATELEKAQEMLDDPSSQFDVFVINNDLAGDIHAAIGDIRHSYPRLIIVLVDESADFATPGRADDVSTAPFEHNDLVVRIKRLNEDRRLQTLRADALPSVRSFAKSILNASKGVGKQQAAVKAVQELGYDYVAFYAAPNADSGDLSLVAQVGDSGATETAPKRLPPEGSLVGWVTQNGQSRTIGQSDNPGHPFISDGRFGSGACVPVGTTLRFGALFACRKEAGSISQENVMMLELVSAQLASALAKEARS